MNKIAVTAIIRVAAAKARARGIKPINDITVLGRETLEARMAAI